MAPWESERSERGGWREAQPQKGTVGSGGVITAFVVDGIYRLVEGELRLG
jgi:hypothetical protein